MLPVTDTETALSLTRMPTLSSLAALLVGAIRDTFHGRSARRRPSPPPVPFTWL